MTTTRKYYNKLIELYGKLIVTTQDDPINFFHVKEELNNLIQRVFKFRLFPLTFAPHFFDLLHKLTIDDFNSEKLFLCKQIKQQLYACLDVSRLRFGGELLHYLAIIELPELNLSVADYSIYVQEDRTTPMLYRSVRKIIPKSRNDFAEARRKLKTQAKDGKVAKSPVTLVKKDYGHIQAQLSDAISNYRGYIFDHYPSLIDLFAFTNKKVRAYVTEAMPKDIYEFRIHSYLPLDGDISIKVAEEFYDFYPTYGNNLEEIPDEQVSSFICGLKKGDLSFENYFAPKYIHRELVRIFISNASEKLILQFSIFLLKCDGYAIREEVQKPSEVDIVAYKNEQPHYFEIYHRKDRNIDAIQKAAIRFKNLRGNGAVTFIFSTYAGRELTRLLLQEDITVSSIPEVADKHFAVDNSDILHWFIKTKLNDIVVTNEAERKHFTGRELIYRLKKCPIGEAGWTQYEDLCIEIFKFLFSDDFTSYLCKQQASNDLRNHRRDLLVHNNCRTDIPFWNDVKVRYKAAAIIVEFKNYAKQLNSTTLYGSTKYNSKNVGNLTVVFSRKGADNNAISEQLKLLAADKLLLCFSDDEIAQMITEKMIGINPTNRLDAKMFELIKKV